MMREGFFRRRSILAATTLRITGWRWTMLTRRITRNALLRNLTGAMARMAVILERA